MASIQGGGRSPQLQIPRGSPARSMTNSSSQLSTTCLVGAGDSPSPSRKRVHPNYLKIDDAVPPNKKLSTPTKEEKETIMKEKELLYKRLAEENRAPFYLTPFPILPLNSKFSPMTANLYSFIQQQQQQHANTQQAFPPNLTLSPSTDLLHSKFAPGSSTTLMANSPGSSSSIVGNTAGISGLPTPGGSSVGTPPRPLYPYPTSLLKFPFSPPTPSSLGLYSPWNVSNRSMSVSSSAGPPSATESLAGAGMLQCLSGSATTSGNDSISTSTPNKNGTESSGPKKQPDVESQISSPSSRVMSQTSQAAETWPNNGPAIQSKPHLKSHAGLTSIQSPLGIAQTPYSMQSSPYPASVSSCPSVSSSSGCSSASENPDFPTGGISLPPKSYVLSEYHVGPHRLINEKDMDNQSEEATTSGRNTPVDPTVAADGGCVLPSDVARKFLSSSLGQRYSEPSTQQPITPSTSKSRLHSTKHSHSAKANSPHPFSVESMSSGYQPSPINQQGYIAGCHVMDRPSSGVSSMSSSLSSRDSTPDPDELKHDPNQPPQGADIFCLVPGRLSLLSSTQKYKVTVDEVRRRLSHPECLNASVLGGILRRAKSKNGGTVLRQRLQEIGVSLPPGRRKQTELSLLSSLVESEALHLAGDFHRICDNFFPHAELGQMIARQHVGTPEAQPRISMVKATQLIVSELQAMLDAVGGPSTLRPNDPTNPYPGLTNFSLLSHGFGNPAINTGLGVLQTYLQELLAYYEGKKPIQPPDNRYVFSESAPSPQPNPESAPSMHGSLTQQQHYHHHPLQNPLLYTTRHYPSGEQHQETVTSSDHEGGTIEVTLKEEPV